MSGKFCVSSQGVIRQPWLGVRRRRQGCGGWRDSPVPEAENTIYTKNSANCVAGTAYLCIDWSDVSRVVPQTATASAVLPALGKNLHTALCGLTETFTLYKTILTHRGRKLLQIPEVSVWLECAGSAGIARCPGRD